MDTLAGESDQASLVTAVAEHGGFDLLPLAYNFRPWCIRLGLGEPKILHLTRFATSGEVSFSRMLTAYWERSVLERIKRERKRSFLPEANIAFERLLDEAIKLRARVLELVADADWTPSTSIPDIAASSTVGSGPHRATGCRCPEMHPLPLLIT